MKQSTKDYLKNLIWQVQLEQSAAQELADEISKTRRKLEKFYKKVIVKL